jgi:hypothetical protein
MPSIFLMLNYSLSLPETKLNLKTACWQTHLTYITGPKTCFGALSL